MYIFNKKQPSPQITDHIWGHIEVEGSQTYKDAKLFPGGTREWDWTETGTHHVPGIQPADVDELLENGAQVIVLSRGMWKRLQVCPETLELLEKRDIRVHVHQTEKAIQLYNQIREKEMVGGLFHSTC